MSCTKLNYNQPSTTTTLTTSIASFICVVYSTFVGLSASGNGGAISSSGVILSVQGSLFISCSASVNSGAIDVSNGNFTCRTTCMLYCAAGTYNAFHAVMTASMFSGSNMTSIAYCAPSYASGNQYHSFEHLYGASSAGNLNSSSNNAYLGGSAGCFADTSNTFAEMCNFYNCSGPHTLFAYCGTTTINIINCNFAYNTRISANGVIYVYSTSVLVQNCVFVENSGSTIFSFSSGSATVAGCVCNVAFVSSGVTDDGSTISLTSTYSMNLLAERKCVTVKTHAFSAANQIKSAQTSLIELSLISLFME